MLNVNGAQAATFTAGSMVTQVGNTSGGGGGQPRGAEDAPGDGKQQFTVEKSTLVDSFCGVEVTVLSLYQSFGTMKHEKTA